MNVFKRILGHIYFVYGMLMFLITMLVIALIPATIALFLDEPKRAKVVHPTYRIWMGIFLPIVFIKVRTKGRELFTKGENYVVVVNHNSFVDIPVSMPWVPGANKTLAKIEMSKIPIFGIIYKAGSILLDRKDEHSRKESFTEMQKTLKDYNLHLTLYPEGTRNKTNEALLPFYDGAFITAIRARKNIIAGLIFNTKKILPNQPKFWAWPHTIDFHFINKYDTSSYSLKQKDDLKDLVRDDMAKYYVAHLK
jgi:1-acyl-sn-glycerol-3-phosphate acyltransferase